MGQPVTTNPVLIALINMTVVFCVLYGLSLVVKLIKVIDPTQKKKIAQEKSPEIVSKPEGRVPTMNAAQEEYDEMILLFTSAIAAYGYSSARIVAVRPVSSNTWSQVSRIETTSLRKHMY